MNHTATVRVELDMELTYRNHCVPVWKATLLKTVDDVEIVETDKEAYAGPNPGDAVTKLLDGFFDP